MNWAASSPDDAESAYRKAAAVAALDERHRLATRLRGMGATVVDAPPGRLLELPVFLPDLHYGSVYQYYDVQVPWYAAYTIHDLTSGGYILNQTTFDIAAPWKFGVKGKLADFQPDELRRQGTK